MNGAREGEMSQPPFRPSPEGGAVAPLPALCSSRGNGSPRRAHVRGEEGSPARRRRHRSPGGGSDAGAGLPPFEAEAAGLATCEEGGRGYKSPRRRLLHTWGKQAPPFARREESAARLAAKSEREQEGRPRLPLALSPESGARRLVRGCRPSERFGRASSMRGGGNWSGPDGPQPPRDPLASDDRPPWVASTLAAILIFTIVVDVLGNLLVILSVYQNKKLRNAGIF